MKVQIVTIIIQDVPNADVLQRMADKILNNIVDIRNKLHILKILSSIQGDQFSSSMLKLWVLDEFF